VPGQDDTETEGPGGLPWLINGLGVTVLGVFGTKGGTAKTTTVANGAVALALAGDGYDVLQIDFDPQADLSATWGIDEASEGIVRVEDLLEPGGGQAGRAIIELIDEPLPLVVPSERRDRVGRVGLLAASPRLRVRLGHLLRDADALTRMVAELEGDWDLIMIDTPAGDTPFARHAIRAADFGVVPMKPGYNELRAVQRLVDDELPSQAAADGTELAVLGVLLVNAERRLRTTKDYRGALAESDGDLPPLYDALIPRHEPVADHARYGLPTMLLEPPSNRRPQHAAVVEGYLAWAEETLERLHAAAREPGAR